MKTNILLFLFVFCFFPLKSQIITNHNPVFMPDFPKPQVGVSFTDPKFGSTVQRITNAKNSGYAGLFPDYSKRQAWNSDESLMMLRAGGGEVLIYNAASYQYVKTLPSNFTGIQDIFWHPANPQLIYFIADNTFNKVDVQTEQITQLAIFNNYAYVTTRAEGNMSNDGHYIALIGYDSNWNVQDFFVYDVVADSVISTKNVAGTNANNLDWLSISPLGNYVIVDYADDVVGQYHGVEIYDKYFNLQWQKPNGAGHSDYGVDTNGKEILVMDFYDANTNFTYIKKYNLSDTVETSLLALSPDFDMHESCRAAGRQGWVYMSTFDYVGRLTDDSASWLPFEDEIFALKTDGSGDVQRLAHHHSRRFSPGTPDSDHSIYFSEPHATANHSGTKILFGSNWRMNMEVDSSVDAYIADITTLLGTGNKNLSANEKNLLKIYPNPISDRGILEFTVPQSTEILPVSIEIFDLTGRNVKTIYRNKLNQGKYIFNFDGGDLQDGIYLMKLTSGEKIQFSKIEIIR